MKRAQKKIDIITIEKNGAHNFEYDVDACCEVVKAQIITKVRMNGDRCRKKYYSFAKVDIDELDLLEETFTEARLSRNLQDDEVFSWWVTSNNTEGCIPGSFYMEYLLGWEKVSFQYACTRIGICLIDPGIHTHTAEKWKRKT